MLRQPPMRRQFTAKDRQYWRAGCIEIEHIIARHSRSGTRPVVVEWPHPGIMPRDLGGTRRLREPARYRAAQIRDLLLADRGRCRIAGEWQLSCADQRKRALEWDHEDDAAVIVL